MAEYNPPLGSHSPKILLENAQRLDNLVNGPAGTVPDRAGLPLESWRYIQDKADQQLSDQGNRFNAFIQNSGYAVVGDYYDGPLTLTEYNQIIRYGNEFWKLSANTDTPFTTTGNTDSSWVLDSTHFVSVGDYTLREDLSSVSEAKGASLVMTSRGTSVQERLDSADDNIFYLDKDGVKFPPDTPLIIESDNHNEMSGSNAPSTITMGAKDNALFNLKKSPRNASNILPVLGEVAILPLNSSSTYLRAFSLLKSDIDSRAHIPLADIVPVSFSGVSGIVPPFRPAFVRGPAFYAIEYTGDIPITVVMKGAINIFWRPPVTQGRTLYPRLRLDWNHRGKGNTNPEIQPRQELGVVFGSSMKNHGVFRLDQEGETRDTVGPATTTEMKNVDFVEATFHVCREITFYPKEVYHLDLVYIQNEGETYHFLNPYRAFVQQGGLSFLMDFSPFISGGTNGNN